MVQRGPDGPKRVPNGQKHLGWPFWSLLDHFGTVGRPQKNLFDFPPSQVIQLCNFVKKKWHTKNFSIIDPQISTGHHFEVLHSNYNIKGISWAYLGHILGVSWAYHGHILAISWVYHGHILDIYWLPRPSSHYKILPPSFSFLIIIISCFSFSQGFTLFSHFPLLFTFWSFSFASLIQATPVNTNGPTGWHIMQILFEIVNVPFTNRNRYHRGISNIAIARDNGSHSMCKNSFVNATCKK